MNETRKEVVVDMGEIVEKALMMRASDIHFVPCVDGATMFFRIDGLLSFQYLIPKQQYIELVARIKILSKIRLDEHFLPQDGRYSDLHTKVDLRVSLAPTRFGFSIVIRLIQRNFNSSLKELGFSDAHISMCCEAISHPHGMILITGPTGSGKTTTLYALLSLINAKEKALITIEDPVEYDIEHTTQIQVNERVGLTFNIGLRSILRQDPDVIVVGEIRDEITAKIATHAALTGHKVFSTLHTSGAIQSVMRLSEMGVQPYVISSAVQLVISQRLVHLLCTKCFKKEPECATCTLCFGKGYFKRIIVAEVLLLSDKLKKLISKKEGEVELKHQAISEGFIPIKKHIESKIRDGFIDEHEIHVF